MQRRQKKTSHLIHSELSEKSNLPSLVKIILKTASDNLLLGKWGKYMGI